jgi:hypothetical protein
LLSQFGIEASPAVTYAIAFAIIFVLLTLFALVLRRLTGGRSMLTGQGGRTRQPRLGIVDVYDLDRQRQLILLRRDNVEHLLLIGGPNDVVIETNIVRVPGARAQAAPELPERIEAGERAPEAVAARPVVEALPLRAANEGGERGRGTVTALPTEAASVGASLQPSPTRAEAVLKPDMVALQGGRAAPRRPEAPPPPPAPASRSEAPRRSAPIPPALTEPRPAPAPIPPIPSPISEPKGPDAAILSDMAKQLEEALKRPTAPAKPPEPAPAPPPAPSPPSPLSPPSPVRAAPTPARPPAPPPAPAPAQPPSPRAAQPEPGPTPPVPPAAPPPPPRPAAPAPAVPNGPAAAESPAPKPVPRPEPPAQKPEPAAEAPPRVSDPFSVEEIEAEFARLLGRPFDKNDKGDKA